MKINRFSREAMNNNGMSDKRIDEAIKAWDEATGAQMKNTIFRNAGFNEHEVKSLQDISIRDIISKTSNF